MQLKRLFVTSIFILGGLGGAVTTPTADAQQGCCSRHGGVKGCGCADGTPLSKTCIKYFPQCQNPNAPAPAATAAPKVQPAGKAPQQTFSAKVVGVSDGDTVTVLLGQETFKIRLNGIDCPESKQAFGTQAKQFASDMVFGKTVTVKVYDKDRYGRLVADIIIGEKNLNRELVKAGLAWHYKAYSKDQSLAQLEQEARQARRGLWADKAPVAPWEFRRKR